MNEELGIGRMWGFGKEGRAQLRPVRKDGLKADKVEAFLSALAQTGNIRLASRAAGVARSSVYRLKRRSAEFRRQWMDALAEAYDELEARLLDRAMNGVRVTVRYRGKRVGEDIVFDDKTALKLLSLHRRGVAEARAAQDEEEDPEALAAEIRRKLGDVRERLMPAREEADKEEPAQAHPQPLPQRGSHESNTFVGAQAGGEDG